MQTTKTPGTKDEQDAAHDPSQKYYDREFNEIAKANPDVGQDLQDRESQAGSNSAQNTETPAQSDNPSDNINSTKENEQAGGNWTNNFSGSKPQKLVSYKDRIQMAYKKGPLVALITAIFGGSLFLGGAGLMTMPITIAEQFTNDTNDPKATQERKAIGFFGHKAGDTQKKLSICGATINIRCKFNTITPEMVERFEKSGFTLDGKTESNGRIAFSSITSPDGEKVTNAAELNTKIKTSLEFAKHWNKVYNLRNSFFVRGFFFASAIGKYNLSKGKKIEGDSKDQAKESYESSVKGEKGTISTSTTPDKPGDNATDEQKRNAEGNNASGDELSKTVNEGIASGNKVSPSAIKWRPKGLESIGSLGCLVYSMSSMIATSAKLIKMARYATFAMIFLTLASTIKAGVATGAEVEQGMDTISPSTYPTQVEDPETGEMIPNPYIGLNALDSEAYKAVAYGDIVNLVGIATNLFVAGGAIGVLQDVVDWMNNTFGKPNIKTTCRIINSPIVAVISFLAAPVFSAAIYALAEIFQVDKIIAGLINEAIEMVAGADLTTDIKGVPAGNIIFIGAAAILGAGAGAKFGMKPGKFPAIKANVAENKAIIEREIALEKHEAAKTPFDPTNRYSFLGSLAYQIAQFMPTKGASSLTLNASRILAIFPSSLSMLTKNANAAYSMPVSDYSEHRFNQCDDVAYKELGATPDLFCSLRFVPFEEREPNAVLDYMENNKQIDMTSGNPLANTHLEKFTKYCAERTDPWGSTSVGIDEEGSEDSDWFTGKKCMEDSEENIMSSNYVGYHHTQQIVDLEQPSGGSNAPSTSTPISGDARALALQVADNPNIEFVNPATEVQLRIFASGGTVYNACNASMTVSKYLLGALLANASKYKILVNNIGFREDRFVGCEAGNYQHPKGTAVDINRIEVIGGESTGLIDLPPDAAIANQYATDFLAALPLNRGGVGQSDHGMNPKFPDGSIGLNGSHLFPDAGNHLHIDARNRENLMDAE